MIGRDWQRPAPGAGGETVCGASKRGLARAADRGLRTPARGVVPGPGGDRRAVGRDRELRLRRGARCGGDRAGGAARAVRGDEGGPDALERLVLAHGEDDRVAVLSRPAAQTFSNGSAAVIGGGRAEALGERGGRVEPAGQDAAAERALRGRVGTFALARVVGARPRRGGGRGTRGRRARSPPRRIEEVWTSPPACDAPVRLRSTKGWTRLHPAQRGSRRTSSMLRSSLRPSCVGLARCGSFHASTRLRLPSCASVSPRRPCPAPARRSAPPGRAPCRTARACRRGCP